MGEGLTNGQIVATLSLCVSPEANHLSKTGETIFSWMKDKS